MCFSGTNGVSTVDHQIMQRGRLMTLLKPYILVSELRKERITQVRSPNAVSNGDGKTQRRRRIELSGVNIRHVWQAIRLKFPSSTLFCPTGAAAFANDATFPFMLLNFLSTLSWPRNFVIRKCLVSLSIMPEASSPSRGFAPEQVRRIVHLLACLPLLRPFS